MLLLSTIGVYCMLDANLIQPQVSDIFERLIVREMNFCQLYVLLNVPVQKENIASKMARNYLANNSSDFDENTSN